MDNQHRKISGYRELAQAEIDLMNEIKGKGVELGELVYKLERMNHSNANKAQIANLSPDQLCSAIEELGEARAWVQEGKMQLKKGLMPLTRAVAKPTFF